MSIKKELSFIIKKALGSKDHMGMGFSSSKIDIYSWYQERQNLINKSSF